MLISSAIPASLTHGDPTTRRRLFPVQASLLVRPAAAPPAAWQVGGRWLVLCVASWSWLADGGRVWAQDAAPGSTAAQSAAETPGPPSSPEALSAYSQAATYQNNRAFDLAAEAWLKFLADHADDPKSVDAQYNLGVCYLELKEFAKSRDTLQQALGRGQDFARREDAFLNLGWATYTLALNNQPDLFPVAEQLLAKLLTEYPQGKYRDQAWFLRGETLYLQGQRAEAAEAYQHLVRDHPDSDLMSNGLYALGVTLEELERFDEAGELYDQFLARFADNPLGPEVRMRKAETVLKSGDVAAAEKMFAEVGQLADFPQADHARYRQAYCAARQERFADAAELFAALTRDFPESRYRGEATLAAARAYFRADQHPQAAEWFDRVLDDEGPAGSEAAHWRSRLHLKAGESEAALQLVDRFLPRAQSQGHPFAANLRMDQADATYELPDRKRQALDMYVRLARELPDHFLAPQALYNAAFAALELQEYPLAQQLTRDFLAKYHAHRLAQDVKRIEAECQLQRGESAAAAKTFGELAMASADAAEARRLRLRQAVALYTEKKFDETLAQLTAQLDTFSVPDERAEALHLIGMSQFLLEQFEPAQLALAQALEVAPRWRQADETLLYLSQAQRRLGEQAAAQAAVERLLRDFPDSALRDQATFRLAECLYASEDYATAAQHYRAVGQHWPESSFVPFSLYGCGWAELRQAHFAEAQAAFSQLLSGFPDHAQATAALYARALARQQAGEFDGALQDLQNFLQRDVNRREKSDALYVQGLCRVGLKQFEPAIALLQLLMQEDPEYEAGEKVLYELGWAYKSLNQPQPAVAAFQQLATRYPQGAFAGEAWYHLGEAHYEAAEYEEAVKAYEQARQQADANQDLGEKIRYKLGWALYQTTQFDAAQAVFAQQLDVAPQGVLSGDGLFMQGECLFQRGKYEEALQQYTQARERTLSSEQITTLAHLHAGQAAGQLQRWQDCYDWLAAIAKQYPQSPLLLQIGFELSVAQQNLGNAAEAERLFGSIADRATGELAARARFMLGEMLYARQEHVQAIREFRKVMFGFDPVVDPPVAPWQAKAGFEAGQCAGVLASQQNGRRGRQQYLELATRFFQYVQTRHPGTEEAAAAAEQLKKYGVVTP